MAGDSSSSSPQTPQTPPTGKPPEGTRPLDSETERVLRGELADLREKLRLADEKNEALESLLEEQEKARAAAKAKKSTGPKVPLAKIEILGEGRRVIKVGSQLRQSELEGLTEGVHYDLGALDG